MDIKEHHLINIGYAFPMTVRGFGLLLGFIVKEIFFYF